MPDTNLISFNGPDDNGRAVSLVDVDASVFPPGGGRYSSVLKCSTGLQDFQLTVSGTAVGGKDSVLDINNLVRRVKVVIERARATGQFVTTVKGGSEDIGIEIGMITGRGSVCEHIFGDWSDQSHAWVKRPRINSRMVDGSAVRVIVLASEFPVEEPGSGPYRYLYLKPWFPGWAHHAIVFGFETLRRWGFFRANAN